MEIGSHKLLPNFSLAYQFRGKDEMLCATSVQQMPELTKIKIFELPVLECKQFNRRAQEIDTRAKQYFRLRSVVIYSCVVSLCLPSFWRNKTEFSLIKLTLWLLCLLRENSLAMVRPEESGGWASRA